jgi:hypothetical protein
VDVIVLKKPVFGVYFFYDHGVNVVRRWFFDERIPEVAWIAFDALMMIYESGGIGAIQACVADLGNGFLGLKVAQRVGVLPCPIFRRGPFDEETEITFLAGARWDEKNNRVRPFSAIGEAEENLELLLEDRTRRRRGQST